MKDRCARVCAPARGGAPAFEMRGTRELGLADVLGLQRSIGNRHTARLIADGQRRLSRTTFYQVPWGWGGLRSIGAAHPKKDEWLTAVSRQRKKPGQPEGQPDNWVLDLSKLCKSLKLHQLTEGKHFNVCYAVVEYLEEDGTLRYITGSSQTEYPLTGMIYSLAKDPAEKRDTLKGHAEQTAIHKALESEMDPNRVTRVYVELEPCNLPPWRCKQAVCNMVPNATVMWSFPYPDVKEDRHRSVEEWQRHQKSGLEQAHNDPGGVREWLSWTQDSPQLYGPPE